MFFHTYSNYLSMGNYLRKKNTQNLRNYVNKKQVLFVVGSFKMIKQVFSLYQLKLTWLM